MIICGVHACTTMTSKSEINSNKCLFCTWRGGTAKPINWDAVVTESAGSSTPQREVQASTAAALPSGAGTPLHIGSFPIPENLSRRALFWHDVYARYSTDDYILHLAEFPEVVLEVASVQTQGSARQAQTHLGRRKAVYRKLLMNLHRHDVALKDQPAAARLAGALSHITDRNKYYKAALSIRIQRGQKEFIEKGLVMVRPYASHIEDAFKAQGLPEELAYVAFVESSFNINAISKVGASGVYQLMPAVARPYMRVTDPIDERRDPIKSAQVAARIMRENFDLLGDWPLAVTAYNHGAAGMRRAALHAGSRDLVIINERYHASSFGFASKNFYTEFLGIMLTFREYAATHPEKLPTTAAGSALAFTNYQVPRDMPVAKLIHSLHTSREELMALNPDLSRSVIRGGVTIPRGYIMKVPAGRELSSLAPHRHANQAMARR